VIPQDLAFLLTHQSHFDLSPFHFELLPRPFNGNLDDAAIILLLLNPGWEPQGTHEPEGAAFRQAERDSLFFKTVPPLFFLQQKYARTADYSWLAPRLIEFIHRFGLDVVARRFMQIQFLPYHSKDLKKLPPILPSQKYSFALVEEAMNRRKEIVIMRSAGLWLDAVPSLVNYPYMTLTNPRNPHLTRTQLGSRNFDRLVDVLAHSRT
jgi:hypothetical protein